MKNLAFFSIVFAFLGEIQGQLTQQLQSDLTFQGDQAKVILQNQTLEVKKEIVGGGEIQILTPETVRQDGLCSFDREGMMQTGRAFVFDEVSIGYSTDAASGKETQLGYNTAAPVALLNSLVIVTQEGREVLRAPFRDLHNIQNGFKANDAYTKLKALCHFNDGKKVEISIKFPNGVSLDGAAKHYVFFRFNGLQTAKRPAV